MLVNAARRVARARNHLEGGRALSVGPASGAVQHDLRSVISSIYAVKPSRPTVLSVSGGGGQGLGWLMSTPGASSTVVEILVARLPAAATTHPRFATDATAGRCSASCCLCVQSPYSRESTNSFLQFEQRGFASQEAAQQMAEAAFNRCVQLATDEAVADSAAAAGGRSEAGASSSDPLTTLRGSAPLCIGLGCTASLVTGSPKRGAHRCSVAVWTAQSCTAYTVTLTKGLRNRCAGRG